MAGNEQSTGDGEAGLADVATTGMAWDGGPYVGDAVDGALEQRSREVLWVRQLYTGLVGFLGAGGAGLYYALSTSTGSPRREWIAALAIFAIVQAIVAWSLRGRFVTDAQRATFFVAWNILSYLLIAAASALDGGIRSPIALIWVLPTVYLMMGFSRAAIVWCGSVSIVLFLGVAVLTPAPLPFAAFVLQLVVIGDAMLMVLMGARARTERESTLSALRSRLARLAAIDGLTGCLNRQAFTCAAATAVARAARRQRPLSMLAVDVDRFKLINDAHGHLTGDDLLRQLGAAVRACVRATDIAGRLGGDELAVLCPGADGREAAELGLRLHAAARRLVLPAPVTLSIGICTLPPGAGDPRHLRECADRALYQAKRDGRNRTVTFGGTV